MSDFQQYNQAPFLNDGETLSIRYGTQESWIPATITMESKFERAVDAIFSGVLTSGAFLLPSLFQDNEMKSPKYKAVAIMTSIGIGSFVGMCSWVSPVRRVNYEAKHAKRPSGPFVLGSACFLGCLGVAGYYMAK